MEKKDYLEPTVVVVEMGYRDPVCVPTSGNIPNYKKDDYTPVWL